MRLESAMRTAMAAAGDEVIKKSSEWSGITGRFDLRGGRLGTQGNVSLYSEEAFNSGKWVEVLWKKCGDPDWDRESSGCLREECSVAGLRGAGSSGVSSRGCDAVNMQVYFRG
jgi:hypothetical protein